MSEAERDAAEAYSNLNFIDYFVAGAIKYYKYFFSFFRAKPQHRCLHLNCSKKYLFWNNCSKILLTPKLRNPISQSDIC